MEEMKTENMIAVIENRDQAQAIANFLWNEREKHRDNMEQLDRALKALKEKWDVTPR